MGNRKKRRYSGNDKHFGPFTLSKHSDVSWRPLGVMLDSDHANDYGDQVGCNLKLHGFGYTFIVELPNILPPFRLRHIASTWDEATVARLGRNWYEENFSREYGFLILPEDVHVHYGPQTFDSETTKSKVLWIPWNNWRHVRFSFYDLYGEHFWTQLDNKHIRGTDAFEEQRQHEEIVPKAVFEFRDYDGEVVQATTHIEEREWRRGIGWFRWLSLFCKPKIRRSLDVAFSSEVGLEKGSWKGGITGHGIDMLPSELHEAAFKRYCEQEHRSKHGTFKLTYIGRVT